MIRSRKYLNAARGQPCSLLIPNVCNGDWETTVAAHIRDEGTGRSIKASDISTVDACYSCHAFLDQNVLTREEWLFYALRGLQRTLERRIEQGVLVVPQDIQTPLMDKPIKPRKPKEQRAKIKSRGFPKRVAKDH